MTTPFFTDQQMAEYHENGYLIVRNLLSDDEANNMRTRVKAEVQRDAYPPTLTYPAPAKYTVSGNRIADSGLAAIAEHPTVVDAVECLLGGPAHLTAFVAYLRTPGDKGAGAHCDYKRWRPVGSSMNWVFAIIPLTDFDEAYGQFLVSPGSHKLTQVVDEDAHVRDLTFPDARQLAPFIDPELKAGDLLLVNQHVWHKAPAGTTSEDRCGFFNKYCAVDAPPAAGYYPYSSAAVNAMSDVGKRLIPTSLDTPITDTRLLIESTSGDESTFLLRHDEAHDTWTLPGGEGWEEEGVGWDVGARMSSLQTLTKTQTGVDISWMSYIDDVDTADGVSRLYGFTDTALAQSEQLNGHHRWHTKAQIANLLSEDHAICHAINAWQRTDVIRGKGKPITSYKQQFD
ncbi:MAG: phytanoyl-CoA dioxygenase family protein [Chloroflexota bacterium]